MGQRVTSVDLLEAEVLGRGGFLQLKRCRAQNRRADGTRSAPYPVDVVLRPAGLDAIVVVPYARDPRRVLLRQGLRPVLRLGRDGVQRDGGSPPLYILEAVAGILEAKDTGPDGLRQRAAIELLEEVGLRVAPEQIDSLGSPAYVSSGVLAEQIFFCALETSLSPSETARGDGTPMEEGGEAVVLELSDALDRCNDGRICDLKTECAIRRLQAMIEPGCQPG